MSSYDFPILPVIEHYSDQPLQRSTGRTKICCLIHDEDRPSMSVDLSKNTWHCFVCCTGGDAIDLIRAMEGVEFGEALQRVQVLTGETVPEVPAGPEKSSRGRPVGLFGGRSGAKRGNNSSLPTGGRGRPRGVR